MIKQREPLMRLIFSDLDGSLLDHYDYSFEPARACLSTLEAASIPLVLVSSKTRKEIEALRHKLDNTHPFVVENGAAIFIPHGYFTKQPQETRSAHGYWVKEFGESRNHWLGILARYTAMTDDNYIGFAAAGVDGIAQMTGLSPTAAALANCRDYSEPVKWLGEPSLKAAFIERLESAGATVHQGGRFFSVSGACDKGKALIWLRQRYLENAGIEAADDLAIGDSDNDVAMLQAAATALLIKSPVHKFPHLLREDKTIYSRSLGPKGWSEGVSQWLGNS